MDEDLLNKYVKDLKKYPVLSLADQMLLAQDFFVNKNKNAFDKLVKTNLRYVIKIAAKYAKRYRSISLTISDFIQAGNIGLLTGLNKYDPNRGTTPISFAHSYIRTEMDRVAGSNLSPIRKMTTAIDRFMIYRRQKIMNIIEATVEEKESLRAKLAEETKLSIEDIKDQEEKYSLRLYSINEFLDNGNTFENLFKSDYNLEKETFNRFTSDSLLKAIEKTLAKMKNREANFIKDLFLNDKTLQSIGDKHGISRERVRQVVENSINKMYKIMKTNGVSIDNYIQID